jgi:integrase
MGMSKAHTRAGKFRKVGQNLYRYTSNGIYYAVFRDKGKLKWKSLKTPDKEMAKRRLQDEVDKARRVDPNASRMSLSRLLELYAENLKTLDTGTIATRKSILNRFKATWPHGLEIQVQEVTPNDLQGWLGRHRDRLRKSSLNEYVRFLRQLFDEAVKERVIADSPAAELTEFRRESPIRTTPTWEEFQGIVKQIRSQRFSDTANDSADVVEFWGLAGAGTAEAANLMGEHLDFERGRMKLYRKKTDTGYEVPLFPAVRPLLDRLKARGQIKVGEPVLRVHDPKKALEAACKALKYPKYSARAFRRLFITRAVEQGVDIKTISAWQGHRDGGVLVAKTYSHLRDAHSNEMAKLITAPKSESAFSYEV